MTLVITIVRKEGVFQSVDCRVSRREKVLSDQFSKQISLVSPPLDGGARLLLGFCGMAHIAGVPTTQWLRETLRGEPRRPDEMLAFLVGRLNRDVAKTAFRGSIVEFIGGYINGDGSSGLVRISNVPNGARSRPDLFEREVLPLVKEPLVWGLGSGDRDVSNADKRLVAAQARTNPRSWPEQAGLLAAVNRRAAAEARRHGRGYQVSPWSCVSYMLADNPTIISRLFVQPADPDGMLVDVPCLLAGVDTLEMLSEVRAEVSSAHRPHPSVKSRK